MFRAITTMPLAKGTAEAVLPEAVIAKQPELQIVSVAGLLITFCRGIFSMMISLSV